MPRSTPHRRGTHAQPTAEAEPTGGEPGEATAEAPAEAAAELPAEPAAEGLPDAPLDPGTTLDGAVVGPVTSEEEAMELGQAQLAFAMALRVRDIAQHARRRGGPPPA